MKQSYQKIFSRNLAHITLVFFLIILLLQSAVGLFFPSSSEWNSIDIVFRTTISSIFGYLISSVGHRPPKKTVPSAEQPRTIGFSNENTPSARLLGGETPTNQSADPPKIILGENLQVQAIILACLGLFSIGILTFIRYHEGDLIATSGVVATVAQYRDIISGSIGALIGLARGHEN